MMLKCRRFYTDQNFRNKVVTYSTSLRDIKWGSKKNDSERQSFLEPVFIDQSNIPNKYNKTFKKSNYSEPEENGIKVIKKRNEKEQSEKEKERAILNGKREMSYRARKRIILRIRGENEEKENEKNNFNELYKNKEKKVKEIEIKLPLDKIRIKRLNNNHSFNHNTENETVKTTGDNDINSRTTKYIWSNINFDINKNNNSSINSSDGIKRKRFIFYKGRKEKEKQNENDSEINNNKSSLNRSKILNKDSSKIYHSNDQNDLEVNNNAKNKFRFKKKKKEKIDINIDSFSHYKITTNNNIFLKILKKQRKGNICLNKNNKTNNEINENQYFHFKEKKGFCRKKIGISGQRDDYQKTENTIEIDDKNLNLEKSTPNINKNNSNINLMKKNHSLFLNYLTNKKQINKINSLNRNNKINKSNKLDPFSIECLDKYNNRTFKLDSHKSDENKVNKVFNSSSSNKVNLHTVFNINFFNLEKHNNNSEKLENKSNILFSKKKFMIYFFEDLIEICCALETKNLLVTLLGNFNQKFYNINNVNHINNIFNKDNENFEYIYKHYGLILVSLIFLSKDNILYSSNLSLIKELLIQLIYSSLNYVEMDGNKESNKIQNFIKDNSSLTVIPNHRYTFNLIKLIFENKKEYKELKNVLEQMLNFVVKNNYKELIKILTESILFCYNSKPKINFYFPLFKIKNNLSQNIDEEESNSNKKNNILISKKPPTVPFIKSPMKKDYCLVLDMDETISHTLKLSFGCYFLLRPGTIDFLKEVSKYYEIIIFTSSQKSYADKILNKIDIQGNLISHRLYKNHVIYEKGKTVKNLNMIGRDLKKTIFIDNLRSNAKYNINNLCPISNWTGDIYDDKLIKLKNKLIRIATCGKYNNDITQGL